MKKVLTTALVLGALYGVANATEIKPYVGLDAGYNKMDTKDSWWDKKTSKEFNYGLNAGAKFELENNLFAGAELYYRLGKLVDYKYSDPTDNVSLEIKNTFGAKFYFGYEFNDKLNAFASFGLNRMNYEYKYDGFFGYEKDTDDRFAPSYGFGVSYQVIDNLEARLSYEFLDYEVKFYGDTEKLDAHSIRLGVNYLF